MAKGRALNLAEQEKEARIGGEEDGEFTVRDHKQGSPAENTIEPINQGEIVYSTECLLVLPERYSPVYRTVYVVEI